MRHLFAIAGACIFFAWATNLDAQSPPPGAGLDDYKPGPDSEPQAAVPKGKTFSFTFENSKIFPGTTRQITVYVPAQYKGDKPACVYVSLDGLIFGVPVVFDNLIHRGEMPVTIGIGVMWGLIASVNGTNNPRYDRSFEFDGLNDSLARCIVGEIFPEVEKRPTPDGLPIKLSRDPNDCCAGGASTGGIGAFTLAWERPDLFHRVFSAIGTFVGMRGGDRYPVLVRKTEPKPIRVFQQDGENDQCVGLTEVGDWWMSNQTLERALEYAGYEHMRVWGTGTHNGNQAVAIFPDAMRFLWKDWPQPVLAHTEKTQNCILQATLDSASTWQLVSDAGTTCDHLAVNPRGEVFFQDTAAKRTRRFGVEGQFGDEPAIPSDKTFAFEADGHARISDATCVTTTSSGQIYSTEAETGKVWLETPDGKRVLLDEGLKQPTGVALTPDGVWLAVMESRTHLGYSYRVKPDGTVDLKQPFYWAHVPDWADDSGAGGMCMDRDGHAYVATHMGVQIFDRNGRSRGILPMPVGEATSVCFGGAKFAELFVTSGGKLYHRHMKAVGAPPFLAPITLPSWGPG
jgi:sugar lactone lactonase YvrE/enterochelin esterase-like enzyme